MAKQSGPPKKEVKYPYPSRFGSHASMVTGEPCDGWCECTDEFGEYETEIIRLDNGEADPNRYAEARLGKLFEGKEKE